MKASTAARIPGDGTNKVKDLAERLAAVTPSDRHPGAAPGRTASGNRCGCGCLDEAND